MWRANLACMPCTMQLLRAGLLIICIGKGTKASEHLMAQDKLYTGLMKLGEATPSYDAELEPSEHLPWQHVTDAQLQAAADEHFTGNILQVLPCVNPALGLYCALDVRQR